MSILQALPSLPARALRGSADAISSFHGVPGPSYLPPAPARPIPPVLRDRNPGTLPGPDDIVGRQEVPLDEVSFEHLKSVCAIAQILHLRGELQLPASALADPAFHTREKKETNSGL